YRFDGGCDPQITWWTGLLGEVLGGNRRGGHEHANRPSRSGSHRPHGATDVTDATRLATRNDSTEDLRARADGPSRPPIDTLTLASDLRGTRARNAERSRR